MKPGSISNSAAMAPIAPSASARVGARRAASSVLMRRSVATPVPAQQQGASHHAKQGKRQGGENADSLAHQDEHRDLGENQAKNEN